MFPKRLSDITAADIQALVSAGIAEGADVEFKRELPAKNPPDPWMMGGKLGDAAKDQLAAEIITFANTDGGTLIIGVGEDKDKRAVPPIIPVPNCKEAANTIFQSVASRVEPRLPVFECEGIVTEADGKSGVVIMRTLASYLAPHRHTQDRHCYVRRNDAAEPMSMAEIQEITRRAASRMADIERAFDDGALRFASFVQGRSRPNNVWNCAASYRICARPFSKCAVGPQSGWTSALDFPTLNGLGKQGLLQNTQLEVTRAWQARLRAFERTFGGNRFNGLDRLETEGGIDRFVHQLYLEDKEPRYVFFSVTEFLWSVALVMNFVQGIRRISSRPSQSFALEIEILHNHPLYLVPHPGIAPMGSQILPPHQILFPRYEIGAVEDFDQLLTTIDTDLWNSAGYQPDWNLAINWPK